MELPPYRLPTWKTTLSHMWDKCAQYLKKMGGMILIASLIVWFLSYYPRQTHDVPAAVPHYESSYLGKIGKVCEPVFSPLGLNWKSGVALLSGVAAKEIVVSTLGVLYTDVDVPAGATGAGGAGVAAYEEPAAAAVAAPQAGGEDAESAEETLSARLKASGDFDTASALAMLVFILLYFPCVATIAAIGAEAGWKWAVGAVVYNTALAWCLAWLTYHVAQLF